MTYPLALGDRCRDRRDIQVPTQPLQARQPFRRSTSLNAFDVVVGQSVHVVPFLLPVSRAVLPPAFRDGKLFEIPVQGGLRVRSKVLEPIEVGLLCHFAELVGEESLF